MKESEDEKSAKRLKFLIVADHDLLMELLRNRLSDAFPGCDLRETRSGEEAIALAWALKPDIVLMDIELPRMDGIEATKRIKTLVPETQVVIQSMHQEPVYKERAIAAGANAYITKDQMQSDLIKVLRNLLPF